MSKKTKNDADASIQITSVRNLRKSIKIEWTQGSDDYSVNFHDNPLPSFLKSLDALVPHVCTLCELPAKDEAKIVATGITVRENGDNSLALIVAKKKIKKGKRVFNIATPLLSMYPDENDKTVDCMDEAEAKAIDKVVQEATKYVRNGPGDRAQGQIDFRDEEGGGTPDENKTEQFPAMENAGT